MTENQAAAVGGDFKHPKCYANTRGGCSTKITGEHYVSHGLIKLYGNNDPGYRVQHRTARGIGHPVQPKEFKANILCTNHNSGLHPADDAALKFATFLRTVAIRYDAGAGDWGDAEEVTVSGDDMQRWVLKLFLNHAVKDHFTVQQGKKAPFPAEAIDLLLDRAAWPRTWGLFVAADLTNRRMWFDPFQTKETVDLDWWGCAPFVFHNETWLGGAIVDLAHVSFGLTLFNPGRHDVRFNNPDNPIRGTLQRPKYLAWELNGVKKRVNFEWDDPWQGQGLTFTLGAQNRTDRLNGRAPQGRRFTKTGPAGERGR